MKRLFFLTPVGALALAAVLFLSACATGAVNIHEGLSPAVLIQRAQEAKDKNQYGIALQYYQVLMERNADDLKLVCEAEYEIAFIHYKQKKYPLAKDEFNALLERYETHDRDLLPPQFEILAHKVLESITEKENRRKPSSRKQKAREGWGSTLSPE